jgi:hypothetical protein
MLAMPADTTGHYIVTSGNQLNMARARQESDLERQLAEERSLARDQLVPLLGQFTAATDSSLPVLQELIRDQEGSRD